MSKNKSTQKVVRSPRRYLAVSKQPFFVPICPLWESGGLGTDPRTQILVEMWLWVHWGYKSPPAPKPAGIYRPHVITGAAARRVSLSGGR